MRHSLRFRALALVFLFNAAVFAALGVVLARSQAEENLRFEQRWTQDLVYTIRDTIRPEGLNVANILKWSSWRLMGDAILVDEKLALSSSGAVATGGIDLNPVGASRRAPGFERQRVLRAIYDAIHGGSPVESAGGRALPISLPGAKSPWGGLWYRTEERVDYAAILTRMLPWFALSTLLLTAVTFLVLRRLVLDPVALLAEGARRVRSGDFSVHLDVPERRDELAELVRSFNEMTSTVAGFNQRLSEEVRRATEKARAAEAAAMRERRLAAMGELAAGIAHEINNPLGGLQNAAEDLKRKDLPQERRTQYLALLSQGLARIGETVNRLRRFTPREAPREPVDIRQVAADAVELVQHRARRLGVRIHASGAAATPRVLGARNEIGQAVLNLLVNALDALEEGGTSDPRGPRIELAIQPAENGVRLVVRDNGPGVEPGALERVGDLFYTTKEVGKGTGLGLALVHSALKQHGGSVRITSDPGRNFQVELWFPLEPPAEEGRS